MPSFWVYNLLHIFVFDPVGVVFASISSGFGEITLLSYSVHFDKWVMSISSTGTRHKQTPLWCIKRHIRSKGCQLYKFILRSSHQARVACSFVLKKQWPSDSQLDCLASYMMDRWIFAGAYSCQDLWLNFLEDLGQKKKKRRKYPWISWWENKRSLKFFENSLTFLQISSQGSPKILVIFTRDS